MSSIRFLNLFALLAAIAFAEETTEQSTDLPTYFYTVPNDGTNGIKEYIFNRIKDNSNWNYKTADGSFREETDTIINPGTDKEEKVVVGQYGFTDGNIEHIVMYTVDKNGYRSRVHFKYLPPPSVAVGYFSPLITTTTPPPPPTRVVPTFLPPTTPRAPIPTTTQRKIYTPPPTRVIPTFLPPTTPRAPIPTTTQRKIYTPPPTRVIPTFLPPTTPRAPIPITEKYIFPSTTTHLPLFPKKSLSRSSRHKKLLISLVSRY